MPLVSGHRHEYCKLDDIIKLFPVSPGQSMQVNTHGIICNFDKEKGEIKLMDETCEKGLSVFINPVYNPNQARGKSTSGSRQLKKDSTRRVHRLPCKTGDIIRIHRLHLKRDYSCQSYKAADLVIFRNFKEKEIQVLHLSTNPSFSPYDEERVKTLQQLNSELLLRADVKLFSSHFTQEHFLVSNTVFQVLAVDRLDNRHIMVCWNGKPFTQYPCHRSVPLDIILEKMRLSKRKTDIFTEETVRRLYEAEKLIFITVYGEVHRLTANKMRPLDTIAIYNLVIKPDRFYYGKYSFLVFQSDKYGRTIRLCLPKSKMATTLSKQIEEDFYFADDYSLDVIGELAPTGPANHNEELEEVAAEAPNQSISNNDVAMKDAEEVSLNISRESSPSQSVNSDNNDAEQTVRPSPPPPSS